MFKTFLSKNAAKKMTTAHTTSMQAKKLEKALKDIQNTPITVLCQKGRAKKIRVSGRNDIYAYRVGISERVIFSSNGNSNLIHDVVHVNDLK